MENLGVTRKLRELDITAYSHAYEDDFTCRVLTTQDCIIHVLIFKYDQKALSINCMVCGKKCWIPKTTIVKNIVETNYSTFSHDCPKRKKHNYKAVFSFEFKGFKLHEDKILVYLGKEWHFK